MRETAKGNALSQTVKIKSSFVIVNKFSVGLKPVQPIFERVNIIINVNFYYCNNFYFYSALVDLVVA